MYVCARLEQNYMINITCVLNRMTSLFAAIPLHRGSLGDRDACGLYLDVGVVHDQRLGHLEGEVVVLSPVQHERHTLLSHHLSERKVCHRKTHTPQAHCTPQLQLLGSNHILHTTNRIFIKICELNI